MCDEKVKGSKIIQALFPGKGKLIEEMTQASKKVKEEKAEKKHRGPTYTAGDVNNNM